MYTNLKKNQCKDEITEKNNKQIATSTTLEYMYLYNLLKLVVLPGRSGVANNVLVYI